MHTCKSISLISMKDGVAIVDSCFRKSSGCDKLLVLERKNTQKRIDLCFLNCIARNIYQFGSDKLPADFSMKITFPEKKVTIGNWQLMDQKICLVDYKNKIMLDAVCYIGFKLKYMHHTIIFKLDNPSLAEMDNFEDNDSPCKLLAINKIIEIFYKLVINSSYTTICDSTSGLKTVTPDEYRTIPRHFDSIIEYIHQYPLMIMEDATCTYKYPIIDIIFKCKPFGGLPELFTYFITKTEIVFEPVMLAILMASAIRRDKFIINKLQKRAEKIALRAHWPPSCAVSSDESESYSDSD